MMQSIYSYILLGASLCLSGCALFNTQRSLTSSDITKTVIRSFDQAVITAIPGHWPQEPALIQRGGNSVRATFLPPAHIKHNNEKITVTIREADIDANDFALYDEHTADIPCPDEHLLNKRIAERPDGIVSLIYCGRLPQKDASSGLVTLIKSFEKNGEIYDMIHSWNGDAFHVSPSGAIASPVPEHIIAKRKQLLLDYSSVCTRRHPEPYCSAHADIFTKQPSAKPTT